MRGLALTFGLSLVLVAGPGCAGAERNAERPATAGPEDLARAVTPERVKAHLVALAGPSP